MLKSLLLLLLLGTTAFGALKQTGKAIPKKRKLERSDGKRWKRLNEVIRAEIKSQTQRFMQERGQVDTAKGRVNSCFG